MGGSESSEKKPSSSSSGQAVRLHVYSPSGGHHAIYHSGVEVLGAEYMYGGGDTSFSGVTVQRPRVPPPGSGWTFYQTVDIGSYQGSREDALRTINDLRSEFPASSYDLMSRNCNHFSEALCQRLCGRGIPSWVNRLAGLGSAVRGAVGAAPAQTGPQRADGGLGGPAAAGLVARSVGADGDLAGEVDWAGVGVLNARETDPAEALRAGVLVSTEEGGSPELLFLLPFVAPAKLQSVVLEAPDVLRAPKRVRLFANQRDLDMDDAAGGAAATQEFAELAWGAPTANGAVASALELNFLKFQNLGFLALYLAGDEDGEEATVALQRLRLAGRV